MNEDFKKSVQAKDKKQGYLMITAIGFFFLGIVGAFINLTPLIYIGIVLAFVFFVFALMSGRSISDDIAYKVAQAQQPNIPAPIYKCTNCEFSLTPAPIHYKKGQWTCPKCNNVNKL